MGVRKISIFICLFAGLQLALTDVSADPAHNILTPWGRKVVNRGLVCLAAVSILGLGLEINGIPHFDTPFDQEHSFAKVGNVYIDDSLPQIKRFELVKVESLPIEAREEYAQKTEKILKIYPPDFLESVIDHIYLGSGVSVSGARVGGVALTGKKGIVVNATVDPASLDYRINHELGHKVLEKYRQFFDDKAWGALLPAGFKYYGNGLVFLMNTNINPVANSVERTSLVQQGFYEKYSTASEDEDFAIIFGNIFSGRREFWDEVNNSPKLHAKVEFIIQFLEKVDPRLTKTMLN